MILNLLNKNKKISNEKNDSLIKMVALLIHAAKIDENYSDKEKKLIMSFIKISSEDNFNENKIIEIKTLAEEYEKNSNQILEFTKELKKMDLDSKKLVLKFLWEIILSDDKSDVYESNLMRRICGLLYLPDKLSGEIKSDILKDKK